MKSFKNLMGMIFVILLILFPLLKYAIQKPGKGDIDPLNGPFEKSDVPEKDNNTKKIAKQKIREIKKQPRHKKPEIMPKKPRKSPLRRSLSADSQNKNSNGFPVISDPENINRPSSANGADLEDTEIEGSGINEISNFPKNRSNSHKNGNNNSSLRTLNRANSKNSKKSNDSKNGNLKKSSVIKNENDSNENQMKKGTENGGTGTSAKPIKLKLDVNGPEEDNPRVRKPKSKKPQIRRAHKYEEFLSKKPTDAEKIDWVIMKKNKKRKRSSYLYLKQILPSIAEDDVIKLETDEPETEESINAKRRTDTSSFSEFRYKIDKNCKNLWNSMKKFNGKDQFIAIYNDLFENKFKNGIQSVHKENLKGEGTKGPVISKAVEKYKNEKRPTIGGVKNLNNNKILNKPFLNNDTTPTTSNNRFDENTLKERVLKNIERSNSNFTQDHWFIRFIEICHNFHSKHMAKNYYKLGQLYTDETSEAFFNWAWLIILMNMDTKKIDTVLMK
ncbi:hypothetical protein NBO_1465g0003 [Nosema bombycis CQ1]|uniref:Uncharacterized protein n=1 Tax=Nosema bombycis (strain CQ1 / CVCC 102059) TaxID=578461 RepID=R0MAX5_NOSB1|nr:hypothetical protein NBO_1465g0003 [Nosema bombycis CQ1]|eukprot:EOB11195.1 hypothetical protein NBO_1465g0003 [Nosema bombycis CQ1]